MWESKMAPLSGVLFGVLLVASFLVDSNTEFMPPAEEVVAYLADGPVTVMAGAYLRLLAAAALVWFSASLYKSLKQIDDDGGRLSVLALGGGVLAASMIGFAATAIIAAAERMWIVESVDAAAAAALFDMSGIAVGNGAAIGFAIMIGAAGVASLRTKYLHRWTGWASVIIALGLISPYAWAILVLVLAWIPIVGIWIYRVESAQQELLEVG